MNGYNFTVILKKDDGTEGRYSANCLTTYEGDWKDGTSVPLLSFSCTNRLMVVPLSQVVAVEVNR